MVSTIHVHRKLSSLCIHFFYVEIQLAQLKANNCLQVVVFPESFQISSRRQQAIQFLLIAATNAHWGRFGQCSRPTRAISLLMTAGVALTPLAVCQRGQGFAIVGIQFGDVPGRLSNFSHGSGRLAPGATFRPPRVQLGRLSALRWTQQFHYFTATAAAASSSTTVVRRVVGRRAPVRRPRDLYWGVAAPRELCGVLTVI